MNRIRISRSRPLFKYLIYFIILFCLYLVIGYTISGRSNDTIIIAGIIGVIAIVAAYNENYTSIIEFDDDNMYISNKRFKDEIPLKQIVSIELSSARVNQSHYWDIKYNDLANGEHTLQILPKSKNFSLFKERVKEKNPSVEITDSVWF
jgi:hypothetical protein